MNNRNNKKTILVRDADELEKYITMSGYSIRGFAKEIPCSQSAVSLILKGERNPSPKMANRFCEILSKPFEKIFFIHDDYKSNQRRKRCGYNNREE